MQIGRKAATISILSVAFSSLFYYALSNPDGLTLSALGLLHQPILFVILLASLIVACILYINTLVRQTRRKSESYLYYFYWSFLTSLPLSIVALTVWSPNPILSIQIMVCIWIPVVFFPIIINYLFNQNSPEYFEAKRFSPTAVGLQDDKYEFSGAAEVLANQIQNFDQAVSVIKIRGAVGEGKSSFLKIMLSKMCIQETLYTYLSLTETNESEDFGKLFAQRWYETLSDRYLFFPKKLIGVGTAGLRDIFRNADKGLLSTILNFVEVINFPILKTVNKAGAIDFYAPSDTAELFNYIPTFQEKVWVVVIDEIERSSYKEILRLIEVIERFKYAAQRGLPIKLVFILPVDDVSLAKRIKNDYEKHDADIISNFLFDDTKSVTHNFWLPPKNTRSSSKHFLEGVEKIVDDYGLDLGFDEDSEANTISMVGDYVRKEDLDNLSFGDDHIKALSFINSIISRETPRIIDATLSQCRFYLESVRLVKDKRTQPRVADLLILSYAKIRYPIYIDFLHRTAEIFRPENKWSLGFRTYTGLPKEEKNKILKWIEDTTGRVVPDDEIEFISGLFRYAANCYISRITSQRDFVDPALIYSTSLPVNLLNYLIVSTDSTKDPEAEAFHLFEKHKKGLLKLRVLKNNELLSYSSFLRQVNRSEIVADLAMAVLEELSNRLLSDSFTFESKSRNESDSCKAAYDILFLASTSIAFNKKAKVEYVDSIRKIIFAILKSESVPIHIKFLILRSLFEAGSGSRVYSELRDIREKIVQGNEGQAKEVIAQAFDDFTNRFVNSSEIIYKKEENPFLVMYQWWSGDVGRKDEIHSIRKVALRGLEEYPDAIREFWKRFPDEEGIDRGRAFGNIGDHVYISLDDLIEVTKKSSLSEEYSERITYWERHKDEHKDIFELKEPTQNHDVTLKRILEDWKLLDKPE